MGRMTQMQHFEKRGRHAAPKPKLSRAEIQNHLNRVFKRDVVAKGVIDPTKGRFRYQWHFDGQSGEVEANTRSEAKSRVKKALGTPANERLPIGVALFKVGIVEGRDVPLLKIV